MSALDAAQPGDGEGQNGRAAAPVTPSGEVIDSATSEFVAQACELNAAPPFGSFVRVAADDGITVYGVVAYVETTGIDPGARPIMRGFGYIRDDLIYAENPDLPHVLRTLFRVAIVGYLQHGQVEQRLPPRPPRLHFSVHAASAQEVRSLTDEGLMYLGTLLAARDVPVDELIAASVRQAAELRGEPLTFARQAGRELAQLLRADYPRLSGILRRMVPGVARVHTAAAVPGRDSPGRMGAAARAALSNSNGAPGLSLVPPAHGRGTPDE